jgi:hypothetical protein
MNPNLLMATAALVAIVATAFVVGRIRVGDWQPRRDTPVLGAIALLGVVAALLVLAPPAIALVGLPVALALAGIYLFTNRAAIEREPQPTRTLLLIAAGGAVALGLFGLAAAVVR